MSLYAIDFLLAFGFVMWAFVDSQIRYYRRVERRRRLADLERWYDIEGSDDSPTARARRMDPGVFQFTAAMKAAYIAPLKEPAQWNHEETQ